ncbi:glycosyltransferase family 2 protein [Dolichospermum sp. ST_con]|nr:glycosyltransferase family 2 protein [Dolichospermum sp. ST_con]MDD1422103.1 glycosyltransferase family 2 protein [Dolichospermum sp. ST_sed1]MDD1428425.1 glycosyltransferase family 2 protein [Dolichospermum sp. ST_sed9]MDD1434106.1 glycosyltransferase family 2 protein [Dolichospermum sp. ST_sed6]MDD1437735.1 glycosyltransferase family 2 protein [Dolichospermum sp. ST_sed10]MDD1441756.1 glycosyltransferase family 2 protein [Dolichospermum sp. ST_sed3]MDD1444941.1 glycosyltransferase family
MKKLLTIAIPTYNRAELLNKQLTWLSQAIKGFESECEILVSDNCSTDHTQSIISKWQSILSNITFKSNKNPENIGVMRNIIYCLGAATTKYVWTIGDDDPIQERAVAYVINKIQQNEDLSLLFLNFSGRNKITGEPVHPPKIVGNRWFDVDSEDDKGDGKAIFEYCFAKSVGAVIFLTATVYRTDLVKRALQIWPTASNNWISLAYLAGYCAANGKVIVTKDIYLECIVGVSYWQKEPQSALLMQYKHLPEVILKLQENGYSKQFYCRMMLNNFKEVNLKVFLGALRRWPVSAIKTVAPFLALTSIAALELIPIREFKMAELQEIPTQEVRKYD